MAEVVTRGIGRVERTADRAQVDVSFETVGGDRDEAVTRLTEQVRAVEPLLGGDGVEVRSRTLSVHDNWDGERRAGSRAVQHYVLRVTELGELDGLLSGLVQAGPQWLNGPTWELRDDAEAVREAQGEAVANARRRAENYAAALGALLGPLQRLSDGDSDVWQAESGQPMMSRAHAGGGTAGADVGELNLQAQQITVTVRCTAAWTLLN
ncbi:SIMPL domain-containing protein [Umezawaea beigongshangensis]|uniref:SIMPL domain-containing protein n=1 Tax=Umezawaea beigongshangensis TaxID=2780383 RepID=UPI0018F1F73B|nr:SIMPL domain-containing protein [Umezawaea beigongshangensis]